MRRRAIASFRAVPRTQSEHSFPLPTSVPDSPGNVMRRMHVEEHRRDLAEGRIMRSDEPDGLSRPEVPPTAEEIWREEMRTRKCCRNLFRIVKEWPFIDWDSE